MKQWLNKWLPVGLWMIVIFIGSSIPNVPRVGGPAVDGWVHRVAHIAEYTVLGWLLLRATANGQPMTRRMAVKVMLAVIAYGISDELHQRFTPGRSSELIGVIWDAIGGAIGLVVWTWRLKTVAKRRTAQSFD